MAKKLRVRDRLWLGFGLFYDYIGRNMLKAGRGSYDCFIFSPPKSSKQSVYNSVQKLLKTGDIEKIIKNGKPYLSLTSQGKEQWKRDFSFLQMRQKKWDRKWRIVIFDLPEENKSLRETLRRKLVSLGFGKLQRSIYISPFDFINDMVEFLSAHKLLGSAFVLTAKHELMGNAKKLANHVWGLQQINEEYLELIKRTKKAASVADQQKRRQFLQEIYSDLMELLSKDPILPQELLPNNWLGDRARKEIISLF